MLLEVSEALAEGQMAGQLDKAQEIAALAAAVTVKEIFAGVDIKRRPGFRVQRTESDELGAVTGRAGGPILPLQVIGRRSGRRCLSFSTSSSTALFCLRRRA